MCPIFYQLKGGGYVSLRRQAVLRDGLLCCPGSQKELKHCSLEAEPGCSVPGAKDSSVRLGTPKGYIHLPQDVATSFAYNIAVVAPCYGCPLGGLVLWWSKSCITQVGFRVFRAVQDFRPPTVCSRLAKAHACT